MKEFQISKFQKGWNKSILPKHILMKVWKLNAFGKKNVKRSVNHSGFIWRDHPGYKVYTSESIGHSDAIIVSQDM